MIQHKQKPIVIRKTPIYTKAPGGPAVIPKGLKPTICPGYPGDTRYQVSGPIEGGFASLGLGRYLDVRP